MKSNNLALTGVVIIVLGIILYALLSWTPDTSTPPADLATTTNATTPTSGSSELFSLLPQTKELFKGENQLFGYEVHAPEGMPVRLSRERFTLAYSGGELADPALHIFDEAGGEVRSVAPTSFDSTASEQTLEFPLRDFVVPRGETYTFWVTADILSTERGASISISKRGLGQRFYYSNTEF